MAKPKHPDYVLGIDPRPPQDIGLPSANAAGASNTTNQIWNIPLPGMWVRYVYHKKCVPAGIKVQPLIESGPFSCHTCGRTVARRRAA